jgi:hypothetical protein
MRCNEPPIRLVWDLARRYWSYSDSLWPVISLGSILGSFRFTIHPPPKPEGKRRGVDAIYTEMMAAGLEQRRVTRHRVTRDAVDAIYTEMVAAEAKRS